VSLDDHSTSQPAGGFESLPASAPPSWPALDRLLEQPRPKFQHRYRFHVLLFVLTLITATLSGVTIQPGMSLGAILLSGLWYSIPILVILAAHEFGHYTFCRLHNVDATLPYFIPAPPLIFIAGTFGAVIRIKEAFPSKKALFDIGVAGPIAGFVALVPFLYWGVGMSEVKAHAGDVNTLSLGEPLLYQLMAWLHFGKLPDGVDVFLHPMAFAAWFGMFATALNLLPFGQLDGGHIVYSVLGRRSWYVSAATLGAAMFLTFLSLSWVLMTAMMLVMAIVLGFRHPRILDEHMPLDGRRKLVALFALVMFILCFTPVPISFLIGKP
jgi:membrane-associated protease RseP (regulator of RpoE activity)